MPKQKGLIKMEGSMDGLTFYRAYGQDIVRRTYGPSREKIMTGASYARVRQNISEFGACSMASKAFRSSLSRVKDLTDGQFGNRLTKLFKLVSEQGSGLRGERAIELTANRDMFVNFEGNINARMSNICEVPFTVEHSDDRTQASVIIPEDKTISIKPPKGATHFRFVLAIGVVSDYIFDSQIGGYTPANTTANKTGDVTHSDYFTLQKEKFPATTLTIKLPVKKLDNSVSVIQAVGIGFAEQIGSVYYPIRTGNAVAVVALF